jgi:hypothetical protein
MVLDVRTSTGRLSLDLIFSDVSVYYSNERSNVLSEKWVQADREEPSE